MKLTNTAKRRATVTPRKHTHRSPDLNLNSTARGQLKRQSPRAQSQFPPLDEIKEYLSAMEEDVLKLKTFYLAAKTYHSLSKQEVEKLIVVEGTTITFYGLAAEYIKAAAALDGLPLTEVVSRMLRHGLESHLREQLADAKRHGNSAKVTELKRIIVRTQKRAAWQFDEVEPPTVPLKGGAR